MKVNKYAGKCHYCNNRVAPKAGKLFGRRGAWKVAHLTCSDSRGPEVVEFYFPSTGNRVTRNVRGLCEDAPCCGCCT